MKNKYALYSNEGSPLQAEWAEERKFMKTVLRPLFTALFTKPVLYPLFVFLVWFFIPSMAQAQWVLVYSAEDQVCQHILSRVNEDITQNGDLDPGRFPEVEAIQWSSENQIMDSGGFNLTSRSVQNRLAIADVNNDGVDEIAQIWEPKNLGGASDYRPSFVYFNMSFSDQIFDSGIKTVDLFPNSLGDPILMAEGQGNVRAQELNLIRLPVQQVREYESSHGDAESIQQYMRFPGTNFLFPMIYEGDFYISMLGRNVWPSYSDPERIYVIRKYDVENNVSDICYMLNIS